MLSVLLSTATFNTTVLKSSTRGVLWKKGVLRNFTKFTGKYLCQSLFFNFFFACNEIATDCYKVTVLLQRHWVSEKLQLAINVKDFSDILEEYFGTTFESRLVILSFFGQDARPCYYYAIIRWRNNQSQFAILINNYEMFLSVIWKISFYRELFKRALL